MVGYQGGVHTVSRTAGPHAATTAALAGGRRKRIRPKPRRVSPDGTSTEDRVLGLQQSAGNAAVAGLIQRETVAQGAHASAASVRPLALGSDGAAVQRAPSATSTKTKTKTAKKKPVTPANFIALTNSIGWFAGNHGKVVGAGPFGALLKVKFVDPDDAPHLRPEHRALLDALFDALRARRFDEWEALERWQTIGPKLRGELEQNAMKLRKTPGLKRDAFDEIVGDTRKYLSEIDTNGFPVKRAYAAAKQKAKNENKPHTPDKASLTRLPEMTKAFFESQKLYEDALKLANSVGSGAPALPTHIGAVAEILLTTKSAEDKFAEARKKLDVFTVYDFLNKVGGATSGTMKLAADIGVGHATKMIAVSTAKNLAKDAARYKQVLAKFERLSDMAGKVGDAATALSIAANYAKLFRAVWERDWDEALASGADLGLDIAGVAIGGGAAGAAVMAGSVIVVKAQLEAIHLAAEFIRWCKDETVRLAAGRFVDVASAAAKGPAWDMVANAEILLDGSKAAIHEVASKEIERSAAAVAKYFTVLSSHIEPTTNKKYLGAHRGVVLALGEEARKALRDPDPTVLGMTDQLDVVFKGVDAMARHVKAVYTN